MRSGPSLCQYQHRGTATEAPPPRAPAAGRHDQAFGPGDELREYSVVAAGQPL
jgi:hypothetical protein